MVAGSRRQDADDLERLVVTADDAADDIRRGGETVAPHGIADDHDAVIAAGFVGIELPPERWRDAEHVEEIGRDAQPLRGAARFRERDVRLHVSGDAAEAVLVVREREVVGGRKRAVVILRRRAVQLDETFGVREGQRPQQQGVEKAEHRRVEADAEREGEDGDERKERLARQRPDNVAQILGESDEGTRQRCAGARRFGCVRLAQCRQTGVQPIGILQLAEDDRRRLVRCHSAGNELPLSIVEMLCQFFDDGRFAWRREMQPRQVRAQLPFPAFRARVTHARLR